MKTNVMCSVKINRRESRVKESDVNIERKMQIRERNCYLLVKKVTVLFINDDFCVDVVDDKVCVC